MAFSITYNLNNMFETWTENSRIIFISMFLNSSFYSKLQDLSEFYSVHAK